MTRDGLDERACGYCRRPWFGAVAYCPYCGRKPSFETVGQEPDLRRQSDKPLASEQPSSEIPSTNLHLVQTVLAAVCALILFWMVAKLPEPNTNGSVPAQLPISNTAQVLSVPAVTESAAPPPPPPPPKPGSLCSAASEAAGLCKE